MKLKQILLEIGDSVNLPNGKINIKSIGSGNFFFTIDGIEYICQVRFPIVDEERNGIAVMVDFSIANDDTHSLSGQNVPLKVMSYVVGGLEKYIQKWKVKFKKKPVRIFYVKFNAKQEDEETGNKRASLYKKFIEKFANRYNTNVDFSGGTNEIIAKFDNLMI